MTFLLFAFTVIQYKHLIIYLFMINIQMKQTSLGCFNMFLSVAIMQIKKFKNTTTKLHCFASSVTSLCISIMIALHFVSRALL